MALTLRRISPPRRRPRRFQAPMAPRFSESGFPVRKKRSIHTCVSCHKKLVDTVEIRTTAIVTPYTDDATNAENIGFVGRQDQTESREQESKPWRCRLLPDNILRQEENTVPHKKIDTCTNGTTAASTEKYVRQHRRSKNQQHQHNTKPTTKYKRTHVQHNLRTYSSMAEQLIHRLALTLLVETHTGREGEGGGACTEAT